jgi:hypothetical protein
MVHRNLDIFISSLMILVLTVFNAGVPIAACFCPMMNDPRSSCGMIPPVRAGLSLTSEIPDCCSSRIIAERNTTPYISIEQFKVSHLLPLDQAVHMTGSIHFVDGLFGSAKVSCIFPSPPFKENISLSILNSTFLI